MGAPAPVPGVRVRRRGADARRTCRTRSGPTPRRGRTSSPARTLRDRPRPDVWSPLEYACHVRDVFRLFDERLHRMLDEDDPQFANWDQDETAVADRYGEQDPAIVAGELAAAAVAIARSFAGVGADQWSRPGRRSDGAEFTVETFARYFVHDPVHHLHDVAPMIRVGVCGAGGRMGAAVCRGVAVDPELELVAAVDPRATGASVEGVEIAARPRGPSPSAAATSSSTSPSPRRRASTVPFLAMHGIHAVVGTTGLDRRRPRRVPRRLRPRPRRTASSRPTSRCRRC